MQKRAFTLIELSIVLTIIGLLIGGSFKVMKMMREKAKTAEAKEQVLGAKEGILGYASQEYFLPLNSEFDANLSTSKVAGHPIFYVADTNLQNDDICAFTTTALDVNNSGNIMQDVAFVIAHEGVNFNMQTALNANVVAVYRADIRVDDNTSPVNISEPYDDIVEWVTLKQLQDAIGCSNKQFRFVTDKLPSAKVGVLYPDINNSVVAELSVENNISSVTIQCLPNSANGIAFATPTFSGIPTQSGVAQFRCTATEGAPSNRAIAKDFSITIDPFLNRPKDANCTNDSECASGICVGGICRAGTASEPCGDDGDCQSGICISSICRSGAATEPCVDSGDCQSGLCVNSVCQAGAVGNVCNNNNQCQSGFCAGGVCTTGAFDVVCDDAADCKSGICQGGLCSGYIGDACSANSQCLSGYCDANRSVCASIPYDTNSTGGGSGGGGAGIAPSCTLASSPSIVNNNQTTTLSYSITNGPASGSFTPSGGTCTSFSNSAGGSCTTARLTRNTSFTLSATDVDGSGSCNTSVCVATRTDYRVRNDTGIRRYFNVDGNCRRINSNSEITTTTLRLNSGESITQHSATDNRCTTVEATMTFNQAVCADTDADGAVLFSGADY
ncbi:MAG: type II secretion system GspH family protein [Sulfurimonas sp.]|nr:type II secretion system GspH family protein [Sulfurimonas sp.]